MRSRCSNVLNASPFDGGATHNPQPSLRRHPVAVAVGVQPQGDGVVGCDDDVLFVGRVDVLIAAVTPLAIAWDNLGALAAKPWQGTSNYRHDRPRQLVRVP